MTQRANCASAFLAIQMQHYVLGYSVPYYMPNAVKALTFFGTVLSKDPLDVGINKELCLGIQFRYNKSRIGQAGWGEEDRWKKFRKNSMETFGKAFSGPAADDLARFKGLVISDENGKPVEEKENPVEVGYWGRI